MWPRQGAVAAGGVHKDSCKLLPLMGDGCAYLYCCHGDICIVIEYYKPVANTNVPTIYTCH